MTSFSIFGTGKMAQAIGGVISAGGANVDYISHEQAESSTITGEFVILAVPHHAVAEIIATNAQQLAAKIVVDITNPVNFDTFDSLVVDAGSSAAAEIQRALPNSHVLKAFNTNFAATLTSGKIGDDTTTVLVAGDHAAAKTALISAVTAGGLDAVDAGGLNRAHELEAVGFLQLSLAASEKISWAGGFALNS